MHTRAVELTEVRTDDDAGTFTGLAAGYDNVDTHGTVLQRGAFASSLAGGGVVPLFWEHGHDDPRAIVGEVTAAVETTRGLEIVGKLDTDTERGAAAYRAVKGRRIRGLSVGMRPTQRRGASIIAADLCEISLVMRPSNSRALVESVRSADDALQTRAASAVATFETIAKDTTMTEPITTERRDELVAETRGLVAAAQGRTLTAEEVATIETNTETIRRHDEQALETRNDAQAANIARALGQAIDTRSGGRQSPFMLSADNVTTLETARKRFENITVLETRAALATTDMGTAREYGPNGLQAPRSLWRSAGIPTTAPDGYSGVVPQFTLPGGAVLVGEGVDHQEFDGVNPDAVTIGRAGAWSTLTSEALLSTSITEVSAAHARIIARNVDRATVAKIEDASPDTMSIDQALVTVAAECACDVSDLWIVGAPAAVAALVGNATFTPANGGDAESYASRYGGAAVYPTTSATADTLTVFHPQSFRAFASPLSSGVFVDPKSGKQDFGQWMFYGLGQALVGAAITVDTTP
uniref:Prohead serine protease domain-containing protein n=1 Tax=Mycobacterium sp. (strain MCS) TaxID=164756 RepID=A0A5Q5BMS7_MYCSS